MRAGEKTPRLCVHSPQRGGQEEVFPEGVIIKHTSEQLLKTFQVSRHLDAACPGGSEQNSKDDEETHKITAEGEAIPLPDLTLTGDPAAQRLQQPGPKSTQKVPRSQLGMSQAERSRLHARTHTPHPRLGSGPPSWVCSRNKSWAWRPQKPSPEKRSQSLPRRDSGIPMATSFRIFSVRNMHTVLPYSAKWSFQRLTLICSLDWKRKHARCTKTHRPQPVTEGAPSAERGPTCSRQFAGQTPLNVQQHGDVKVTSPSGIQRPVGVPDVNKVPFPWQS